MSNWEKWFEKLGLDPVPWRWRFVRWQRSWDQFVGGLQSRKQHVTYANKLCPECGGIVSREDKQCMRCGADVGAWKRQVAQRVTSQMLPKGNAVTAILMGICICIYLLDFLLPGGFNMVLAQVGGIHSSPLPGEDNWFRFFSAGFLHGNLMHIAFNMMAIWSLGVALEEEFGSRRFLVLYLLSLLGGTCFRYFWPEHGAVGIGASGAVMGLIGAGVTYGHLSGHYNLRDTLMSWIRNMVVFSIIMEVASRMAGGVRLDHLAHAGGFLGGAVVGWILAKERRAVVREQWPWAPVVWQLLAWGLSLASLVAVYQALAITYAIFTNVGPLP